MSGHHSNGSFLPLLAPVAGVLVAGTLATVAIIVPEHRFAGAMLTGAIAGGIAALALLGVTARRGSTTTVESGSNVDAHDLATRLARIDEHVMLSD